MVRVVDGVRRATKHGRQVEIGETLDVEPILGGVLLERGDFIADDEEVTDAVTDEPEHEPEPEPEPEPEDEEEDPEED